MSDYSSQKGRVSLFVLVGVVLIGVLVPIAVVGWRDVYEGILESNSPQIVLREVPRGVGQAPVRLVIEFSDAESGLDEIVIRASQNGQTRELDRQSLGGLKAQTVTLNLPGRETGFAEGEVEIQIRAFDRSFWSNRGEKSLTLGVDYRAPLLEVLSEQHNAQIGGSQLLVYRAVDESLALSGVKVGKETFLGYPARLLDPDIRDENLYAVIYAIPLSYAGESTVPVRAFAEDEVGNAVLGEFYSKEAPRRIRARRVNLSAACLRTQIHSLAEKSFDILKNYLPTTKGSLAFTTSAGSPQRYLEEFKILNEDLRGINDARLHKLSKSIRFQRYWFQPFVRQFGVVRYGMGERLAFFGEGRIVSDLIHAGYFYRVRTSGQEVVAAGSGVVAFTDTMGDYGNVIGIDHGLGLFSLYGNLGGISVSAGESVTQGDSIGSMGQSGLVCESGLFFQMRVQGVPVEPAEWLSTNWYSAHIQSKIRRVKRRLGITTGGSF